MDKFDRAEVLQFIFEAEDESIDLTTEDIRQKFPEYPDEAEAVWLNLQQLRTPLQNPRPRKRGDVVGEFELIQKIGHGGNGEVWEAISVNSKERVALKLLQLSDMQARDELIVERLKREYDALFRLSHSNIVQLSRPTNFESETPVVVMKLLGGSADIGNGFAPPITQYCDAKKLGIDERIRLFIPVCRAIAYAHQNLVVHRDVKPSNVLVAMNNDVATPTVIDFGLAKFTDSRYDTVTKQFVGTYLYTAPEQLHCQFSARGISPDVFSLGVLLFELLTGTTPILVSDDDEKASNADVIQALADNKDFELASRRVLSSKRGQHFAQSLGVAPTRISKILRQDLDWIIHKALQKSPEDRYQSADVFANDLENYLNNLPISTGRPTLATRLKKAYRRNRVAAGLGILAFSAVLFGICSLGLGIVRAKSAQREEERQRKSAEAIAAFLKEDLLELVTVDGQLKSLGAAGQTLGKDATLRTLLDRASRSIEGRSDLPEGVKGELLQIIGVSYRNLGAYADSSKFLKLALEMFPDRSEQRIEAELELALSLAELAKFTEAEKAMKSAKKAIADSSGVEGPGYMNAELLHAEILYRETRHDEELVCRKNALAIAKRFFGNTSKEAVLCELKQAQSLHSLRQVEEALATYEELKQPIKKMFGASSLTSLHLDNCIAAAHRDLGDFVEAAKISRRVLAAREKVLEPNHPLIIRAKQNLAVALRGANEFDESQELLHEVLSTMKKEFGPEHPSILEATNELALAFAMADDLDKALPMFHDAHSFALASLGKDHPETLMAGGNLAQALLLSKKHLEAAELLEELLVLHFKRYGIEFKDTVACILVLKDCADSMDKEGRAAIEIPEEIAVSVANLPEDAPARSAMELLVDTLRTDR